MTLSSPVAFNACFQVTEQILYKNDKEQLRSKTVTTTLDPERLGLSRATDAKGYIGMDPSWYSHALPPTDLPPARAGSSVLERAGGRFIVPRSCSSTVRPGGIHTQSLGGQEPLVSDQIHQLRCCRRRDAAQQGLRFEDDNH